MVQTARRRWLFLPLLLWVGGSIHRAAALPVFANAPYVTTLYERENKQTTLATLTCTDPGNNPVISATKGGVTPNTHCANCFSVFPLNPPDVGKYNLVFYPLDTPNPPDVRYLVSVTCVSGSHSVTADVDIRLLRNTPPRFKNGMYENVTWPSTASTQAGRVIATVEAEDDNLSDTVTFSMTSDPVSNNFEIGPLSGEIKAKNPLDLQCTNSILFKVYINDGVYSPVGPKSVDVTLLGSNQAPVLTNLDVETKVAENSAAGTSVFGIASTDDNLPNSKLTYTMTASPSANLALFEIKGNEVQVKGALNYESFSDRVTDLTIQASDGACTSGQHNLRVTITDVNEPPDLTPKNAVYSVHEGSVYLSQLNIPWTVTDEDAIDNHVFSIVGGNANNYFSIDPSSGQLLLNVDYDIDNGVMPIQQVLQIQVTDKGSLTNITDITLRFKDTNDKTPVISPGSFAFSVCEHDKIPGATMATMTCTDEDTSFEGNDDVYFTGGGGGITILTSGEIIMSVRPAVGQTFTTIAYCRDRGIHPGPLQSAGRSVAITGVECTTTTSTTTTPTPTTTTPTTTPTTTTTPAPSTDNVDSWTEENLWWIVLAALLTTGLVAALGYMLWTYCWPRMTACRFPRRPRPQQPRALTPPQKITPVEEADSVVGSPDQQYEFWKERYPNDDYLNPPERQGNPRPISAY